MRVGGGVCRGPGDGGTCRPLAPSSAHPDDVGWDHTCAEMAGGGLLPLRGPAQEMAILSPHDGQGACEDPEDTAHDRCALAAISPRFRRLLGEGESACRGGRPALLPGQFGREPADLAAADTPLRWPAGGLVV